jgi:hypothetical protein
MGRETSGGDRPLSEEEVVERIEDAGSNQPEDPDRPAAGRRQHDEGDPTDHIRETGAQASGRGADPEGRPTDDA